jgi:flagellar protein FlbD
MDFLLPADMPFGIRMIWLTRLNRLPLVLNSDLIEHIDVTPDTVIALTTGQILRVRESAEDVVERIIEFRRRVCGPDADPTELCRASVEGQPDAADDAENLEERG